ncbi:undecaprenyldiphospho-muramoylpentapeptide beta-N- acetylglucosaminyltransferase [compost metagenome]
MAEDHQTKNAMALVQQNAALLIADRSAEDMLVPEALALLEDKDRCKLYADNIGKLALPDADNLIAKQVMILAGKEDRS